MHWILAAAIGACLAGSSPVAAQTTPSSRADILVLPFINHTGRIDAATELPPRIRQRLRDQGARVMFGSALRKHLRHHRIRSWGQIGAEDARILARETGARYALLGSLDFFRDDLSWEFGVSARILDLQTLNLVRAASVSATTETHGELFGTGRTEHIAILSGYVLDELFEQLGTWPYASADDPPEDAVRIAIVPLDIGPDGGEGGAILGHILLSRLIEADYVCVEPGFIHELFLNRKTVHRGQIDLTSLERLEEEYGVCLVVTGVVDRFEPAYGDLAVALPQLEFGMRILDARTGRMLETLDLETNGSDGESLFRWGRETSMGRLARKSLDKLLKKIKEQSRRCHAEAR